MGAAFAHWSATMHRRVHWWPPLLFLSLSVAFFLPALVTGRLPLPTEHLYTFPDRYWLPSRPARLANRPDLAGYDSGWDINYQWFPYRLVAVRRLLHGQIPLWNPQIYSGMPFLGAEQAAILYPLNLIFAPFGPYDSWTGTAIARLFLMGWGLFLVMRRLRVHSLAACWSGVTYQFCASGIAYLHWVNHNVLAFLPLALYSTMRLVEAPRGRWFLLLTGSLAAAYLGGHPETALLFALIWGSFALLHLGQSPRRLRSLLLLAGAVLAAIGLTLPELLAAVDLIPRSVTYVLRSHAAALATLGQSTGTWANLRSWLLLVNPYLFGSPVGNRLFVPGMNYHLLVSYMGIGTLPFVVAGAIGARWRAMTGYWVGVAALSLALIYPLPGVDRLLTLPLLNVSGGMRPNFSWSLAAAVLAGLGVDGILRGSRRARWIVVVAGTLAIFLLAATVYDLTHAARGSWLLGPRPRHISLRRIAAFYQPRNVQVVGLFAAAVLGWLALLGLPSVRWRGALLTGMLGITVVDLFCNGVLFNDVAVRQLMYPETHLTRVLHASGGLFRIATTDGVMFGNASMTQGLDNAFGNDDLVDDRYQRFADHGRQIHDLGGSAVIGPAAQRFFDLANVKYLISAKPVQPAGGGPSWHQVAREGHLRVYQNPMVLPRAYPVDRVQVVAPEQAMAASFAPTFDPSRSAIVEAPVPELGNAAPGPAAAQVTIVDDQPEHVVLAVSAGYPVLVVLADSDASGWQATVDGASRPVYRTNVVFRGVVVGSGQHRLVFRYQPVAWRRGRVVALATLLVCLGGCAWRRRSAYRAESVGAPAGRGGLFHGLVSKTAIAPHSTRGMVTDQPPSSRRSGSSPPSGAR